MITISLCMIVKNEEAVLDRCLSTAADLMDEIIIIDTGSSDRTKEIAFSYTDKVFDFAWTGSFADARNFSFSKASMEYIYCADADEVIDKTNQERFWLLKQSLLPEIEIVQMYYANQLSHNTIYNFDKELRPKLYRRCRTFIWDSAIHEAVLLEPVIYDSDIEIIHMPTGNHASRDLAAFEQMFQNGERLPKRLHNIYAKELMIAGEIQDFKNALPIFLDSLEDTSRSAEEHTEAICILTKAYRIINDDYHFFKYAMKGIASEGCSEICYELGEFYLTRRDYNEAVIWFYNAAYETESMLNIHSGGDSAFFALAECYRQLGFEDISKEYQTKAEQFH